MSEMYKAPNLEKRSYLGRGFDYITDIGRNAIGKGRKALFYTAAATILLGSALPAYGKGKGSQWNNKHGGPPGQLPPAPFIVEPTADYSAQKVDKGKKEKKEKKKDAPPSNPFVEEMFFWWMFDNGFLN